jgi:DNA-binding CsgD family transcriptional regulator/tetratricopeptide (TPR) repeat protein
MSTRDTHRMDAPAGVPLPRLVGRDHEMARLRRALDDAAAGRGACWFVLGEPGSGKTRLASELLGEARAQGLVVCTGGASGVVPSPAYGVVAQALRSHVGQALHRAGQLDAYAAGLTAVLPELPLPREDAGITADQRRLLAAEGTFQLLAHIGRRHGRAPGSRGVVVCLDDLQWADPESLEIVFHLAAVAGDSPIVVLCAVRSGENSQAEALARRLAKQDATGLLELAPLSVAQVATVISALLGAPAPGRLVADVAERSAGLPLLVEEVIDAYLGEGALAVEDGVVQWVGPTRGLVPPSMTAWVESRLDRLGDQARGVVAAAAILDRFDHVLVAVADGAPVEVEQAVQAAVDAGLIDRTADGPRFHHDLVRDAVARLLLPFRAELLHRRAAAVLARHDAAPEEQARHLEAVGEHPQASVLLVEAAKQRLRVHALPSAEALAAHALRLAPGAGIAGDAREVLAASLAAQGRWTEALESDRELVRAGRVDASVVARMVETAVEAGRIEEAVTLLSSDEADLLSAARRGRLLAAVTLARGELGSAAKVAQSACHAALAAGEVADACASLNVLGRALDLLGRHDAAAHAFERWATLAGGAGLVSSRLHALVALGGHRLLRGLPAAPVLWEARELGLGTNAYLQLGWAELHLIYAVQFTRPAGEAIAVADEAVARARRFRLDILPHLLVAAATAYLPVDPKVALRRLHEAIALRPGDEDLAIVAQYGYGLWALYEGRYDDAATHWQACVDAMREHRRAMPSDAPAGLALVLLTAGRRRDAADALVVARNWPVRVFEYTFDALTALVQVLLDGRFDEVAPALEPMRTPEPFLRAGVLVAAAGCVPNEVAAPWLREALDQFVWGGWERAAALVRRRLRATGAPVPRARRTADGVPQELRERGVTPREADVLPLVAAGMGNRAIADDLHLSIRTVESHLSSLLTKLAAENRTELAARYLALQERRGHQHANDDL